MLALLLLVSCVSKGSHEMVQVQLDATRTALNARNAACYAGYQEREAVIAQLQRDLDALAEQNAQLGEDRQLALEELILVRAQIAALATTTPPTPPPCPPCGRGKAPVEVPPPVPLVQATAADLSDALAVRARQAAMARAHLRALEEIYAAFRPLQEEGRLLVQDRPEGVAVVIPTIQLFDENGDRVSPRGEVLLERLSAALALLPGRNVQVASHTDDEAYHTARFPSSWELCFHQAMTVVRALKAVDPTAHLSAASFAGERPVASNATPEGRRSNTRIELLFEEAR